jgi:hypothetical protein
VCTEQARGVQMSDKIPLTIGFWNLAGSGLAALVTEDVETIGPLFERTAVFSAAQVPNTVVLFVYARMRDDGTLEGATNFGIYQVAPATGARIVVLASPNPKLPPPSAAAGPGRANFVFTLNRNGPGFAKFFHELFDSMRGGATMLDAWVKLAPQMPGGIEGQPETVFLPEAGDLAFPPRRK